MPHELCMTTIFMACLLDNEVITDIAPGKEACLYWVLSSYVSDWHRMQS